MPGRSVGHIQVTVDASTGRLVAQLTEAGVEAGKAFKEASEKELSNLQATIDFQNAELTFEIQNLRKRIEAALAGVPLELDFTEASAELKFWTEEQEARDLLLSLALNEASAAELAAKVEAMTEDQKDIIFGSELDTTELQAEVEAVTARKRTLQVEAEIDTMMADAKMRRLAAEWEARRIKARIDAEVELHQATAALEAFERQQHRIQIGMDLDVSDLQRQFREMRIATEHERWDIQTRAVTGTFQAEINRIRREEEAEFVKLRLELDKRTIAEFKAEVARLDAQVDLELQTAKASAEMATWRVEQQANALNVPLDPDLAEATVAFDAWLARQSAKGIDVNVDPDTVRATIQFEAWIQAMQRQRINVDVDTDQIADAGGKAGDSYSRGFGSGFLNSFFDQEKLIAGAIAFLGNDIAVVLEGGLSAAVAVVSSAFSAIGGMIGGLIPLVAGLVPALGAVVVGFQGVGSAISGVAKAFNEVATQGGVTKETLDKLNQSMAGLAPGARDFVSAFAEIFPQLDRIQRQVQGALFEGLDSALRTLSTTTIPDVGRALQVAAGEVNDFIRNLADAAQGIDFSGLIKDLRPAIDAVGDALVNVFQSFEPLIKAATPAAKELAASFREATQHLQEMIERGQQSGALTQFFNEGIDSLKVWWELIRNIGDALFTLFQAGKAQGDSFVQSLADIVAKFDDWMESAAGQTALAEFFELGRRTMEALVPILKGLQGLFDNLVSDSAVSRLEDLTDALGRALPFLGQILDVVGRVGVVSSMVEAFARIGEAIQPAVPALQDLADGLGEILVGAIEGLTPLVEGLGPIIGQIAEALTPLGPPLIDIAQKLLELVTPPLLDALGAFADALSALSPLVVDVLDVLLPFVDAAMVPLVAALQLATPLLELAAQIMTELAPILDALKVPLQVVADIFMAIQAPLKIFTDAVKAAGINLADLSNPAAAAGKVIHEVFTKDLHGSSVIAEEAATRQEDLAKKIQLVIGAAQVMGAEVEVMGRKQLASSENLGGFAVNADTAAEATAHFTQELADVDPGALFDTSDALSRAADAADDASDSADILRDSWDRLFGGAADLSEATDAFAETLLKIAERQKDQADRADDLAKAQNDYADAVDKANEAQSDLDANTDPDKTEQLTNARDAANRSLAEQKTALNEANKAMKENLFAVRGNTEAALENRDTIRQGIDQAIDIAAAKVREGASWDEARKSVIENKKALVEQLVQQGFNREAVRDYINQLNLTPKNIRTAIELANREAVGKGLDDISFKIKTLDGKGVTTPVKVSGLEAVMAGLDGIKGTADDIDRKTAKLAVSTEGVPTSNAQLQSVIDKANELDGKKSTVTVDTNFNFNVQGSAAAFFQSLGDRQFGGVTRGPMIAGEAGNEFIRFGRRVGLVRGPTLLPGGVHVTSTTRSEKLMRDFIAAMARGGGGGPSKQYNVVNNITPLATDPESVATSVVNRIAALAAR